MDEEELPEEQEEEEHTGDFSLGPPAESRIRRTYTLSAAALKARRENAKLSTGPRTPEGKAVSGQNGNASNWIHGIYAQHVIDRIMGVCHKRCSRYPDCEAVSSGRTKLGQMCLDHDGLPEKIMSLVEAARTGNPGAAQEIQAGLLALNVHLTERMLRDVYDDGNLLKERMVDKDGKTVGWRVKAHPLLPIIQEALSKLGVSWDSMLLTPKSRLRSEDLERDIVVNITNYGEGKMQVKGRTGGQKK